MIVGYLGKVVKEPLVVTICSVFGVVLDAASYLPAGKSLNRYSCAGLYSHYTQASGSSKVSISDYPVDEFSYSDSFWNSVIAYAENHFEDSDLVLFTTTIYDTSDSSVDASLSSESNLR